MKSSITDWIQAVAVVIAIVFGIWEFALHDRSEELERKAYVNNMIMHKFNESYSESITAFFEIQKLLEADSNFAPKIDINTSIKFEALFNYYESWGFCFENGLCDGYLAKQYICKDLVFFDTVMSRYYEAHFLKYENEIKRSFEFLLASCQKWT